MGKVTDELIALITKQVDDYGIVVWYDPEHIYDAVVDQLGLSETTVLRYQGSFFKLRSEMEPLLEFVDEQGNLKKDLENPPRLVAYVPLDRSKTQHALIEAEAAGVVMEPGGSPWQRNTRLKVLAERVFKRIAPDRAGEIAAEVEAGRRTLAELDWLADQTGELGAVKLIFGTTAVSEVIPVYIGSEEHDKAIVEKNAAGELASLVETEFGFQLKHDQAVGQLRHELCRSLLLAELALRIKAGGGDTSKLAAISKPDAARQIEQLLSVCQLWRNRLDLKQSYAEWANKIQTEAQVIGLGLDASVLIEVETFSCVESLLLDWAEATILEGNLEDSLEIAKKRKSSFWSLYDGEYQLRWTLLEMAAQLLLDADRIKSELKTVHQDAKAMIEAYTEGIAGSKGEPALPWCTLDRQHRHLEHRYSMLELQPESGHEPLEKVIAQVRYRYAEVTGQCAESLANALVKDQFVIKGLTRQQDVFAKHVQGPMNEAKTVYFLVDALRFEMAQELIDGLSDGYDVKLIPTFAQLPTLTEIGMAALLADTDKGTELVDAGSGKVGLKVGEVVLKDRSSRMKYFESKVSGQSLILKLNELMKPTKKKQQEITDADVILVTSQEIDRRGEETEDEEEARRFMDEVLEKLRRGIRRLASLGVQNIIVVADHGYVFVDEPDDSMKIDSPGGETVDLHSRVWIGRGGSAAPGYIRVKTADLGLGGDLELAFPLGIACFRTRGSSRGYFHGGISLQEILVPVTTIAVREIRAAEIGTTSVTLTLAKPKITTRFFSVEARYVAAGLFGEDAKRIRVVVRTHRHEVGTAAMAAYGFEEGTQEILLEKDRSNAITIMLTSDIDTQTVSVHVLDATTQVELAALKNIPVEITI